jgi:hypothetical protein
MHEVKKQNSYLVDRQQRGSVKELHASVDGLLYMNEEWRDVKGYEGLYQVSNYGRVKSLERTEKFGEFSHRTFKSVIKKQREMTKGVGYLITDLSKKRIQKTISIHRLVAENFILNPFSKKEVNHKDGNKLNNQVLNLEWVTPKENIAHAISNGKIDKRGEKSNFSKLTSKKVIQIRKLKGKFSHQKISEKFKVSRANISIILQGKTWKHI